MGKVYAAHPGQPGHPDGELDLPGIGRAISRKKRLITLVTLGDPRCLGGFIGLCCAGQASLYGRSQGAG